MKKNRAIILALFIGGLLACNSNDQAADTGDNSKMADTDSLEVVTEVQTVAPWQTYMTQQVPDFDVNNFTATITSPLEDFNANPVEGRDYSLYKRLFAYNSDSSKAIDIYSYNLMLRQRGNDTIAMNGEPDSQINLLDIKNKTSKRIFYAGPGTSFWDARWVDSNQVIVTGTEDNKPAYWNIQLDKQQVILYEYNDSVNTVLSRQQYLAQKLPGFVFR